MADFCRQCAGCGFTFVDHAGQCLGECLRKHNKPEITYQTWESVPKELRGC